MLKLLGWSLMTYPEALIGSEVDQWCWEHISQRQQTEHHIDLKPLLISTFREYSKLKGSQAAKVTKALMANIRKICASKNK